MKILIIGISLVTIITLLFAIAVNIAQMVRPNSKFARIMKDTTRILLEIIALFLNQIPMMYHLVQNVSLSNIMFSILNALCGVSLIVIYFVTKYKSEQENIEKE
jgi:hypothetical protein